MKIIDAKKNTGSNSYKKKHEKLLRNLNDLKLYIRYRQSQFNIPNND